MTAHKKRGFEIQGSGGSPIELFMHKRKGVLVTVLADPTGSNWPEQTTFKSLAEIWRALNGCGRPAYNARATKELRDSGKTTLDCGATIEKAGKSFNVVWPDALDVQAIDLGEFGQCLRAGQRFELPNLHAFHSILYLWGVDTTRDVVYDRFRANGRIEVGEFLIGEYVPRFIAGRAVTIGKPNQYQQRMKVAKQIIESNPALAEMQADLMKEVS